MDQFPARFRPCAIQHAGEQHPRQVHKRGDVQLDRGHVRRQVTFRGESATAADASVVHQDLHRTACERRSTRERPPGRETGLKNTAARANARRAARLAL